LIDVEMAGVYNGVQSDLTFPTEGESHMSWSFVCGSPEKDLLKLACREMLCSHLPATSELRCTASLVADACDALISAGAVPDGHLLQVQSHGHITSYGVQCHIDLRSLPLPLGMIITPPSRAGDLVPMECGHHE
jgi:hypothetical protein